MTRMSDGWREVATAIRDGLSKPDFTENRCYYGSLDDGYCGCAIGAAWHSRRPKMVLDKATSTSDSVMRLVAADFPVVLKPMPKKYWSKAQKVHERAPTLESWNDTVGLGMVISMTHYLRVMTAPAIAEWLDWAADKFDRNNRSSNKNRRSKKNAASADVRPAASAAGGDAGNLGRTSQRVIKGTP